MEPTEANDAGETIAWSRSAQDSAEADLAVVQHRTERPEHSVALVALVLVVAFIIGMVLLALFATSGGD